MIILDGFGLLGSVIDYAATQEPVRLIVSTHFYELAHDHYLQHLDDKIQYKMMQVFITEDSSDNEVVYLFKVIDGACSESLGSYCAKRANIAQHILERGK